MAKQFFMGGDAFLEEAFEGFAETAKKWVKFNPNPEYFTGVESAAGRQVALVSGGGSGHEPLHTGFIGEGLLDAVAPGKIFASPHNRQVYEASKAVAKLGGVLHIVKNYTGDKINFGIAAERLKADGIEVERVVVADDIATDLEETATGMRGTGSTLFVEKILGAAADNGATLTELKALGETLVENTRSIAVASEALTNAHTGKKVFDLSEEELEYGVGIHGERAVETIARPDNQALLEQLFTQVTTPLNLKENDRVIVLVNNLGAATPIELYSIFQGLRKLFAKQGTEVADSLVGSYVTALDMRGFSVSVLKVVDDSWLTLWQQQCSTAGWTVK